MTVLITGANRGIGLGLFEHYRARDRAALGTSRQGETPFLSLDVCDTDSFAALAARLDAQPISLLICNAGVFLDKGEDLNTGFPPELWASTFATNVAGVFRTVQTLLPNLRAAKKPRIAIISSDMASNRNAEGGSYIYRASKAASLNLGRNLATDLRRDGIAVGIYHPGWVRTDMGGKAAEIPVAKAVAGLAARFDDLSMASTGCFLNWEGSPQAY